MMMAEETPIRVYTKEQLLELSKSEMVSSVVPAGLRQHPMATARFLQPPVNLLSEREQTATRFGHRQPRPYDPAHDRRNDRSERGGGGAGSGGDHDSSIPAWYRDDKDGVEPTAGIADGTFVEGQFVGSTSSLPTAGLEDDPAAGALEPERPLDASASVGERPVDEDSVALEQQQQQQPQQQQQQPQQQPQQQQQQQRSLQQPPGIAPPQPMQPPAGWVYLDSEGRIQGPFSDQEMKTWDDGAFFPGNLLVKRTTEAGYITLDQYRSRVGGGSPFAMPPPVQQQPMHPLHPHPQVPQHPPHQQQQQQHGGMPWLANMMAGAQLGVGGGVGDPADALRREQEQMQHQQRHRAMQQQQQQQMGWGGGQAPWQAMQQQHAPQQQQQGRHTGLGGMWPGMQPPDPWLGGGGAPQPPMQQPQFSMGPNMQQQPGPQGFAQQMQQQQQQQQQQQLEEYERMQRENAEKQQRDQQLQLEQQQARERELQAQQERDLQAQRERERELQAQRERELQAQREREQQAAAAAAAAVPARDPWAVAPSAAAPTSGFGGAWDDVPPATFDAAQQQQQQEQAADDTVHAEGAAGAEDPDWVRVESDAAKKRKEKKKARKEKKKGTSAVGGAPASSVPDTGASEQEQEDERQQQQQQPAPRLAPWAQTAAAVPAVTGRKSLQEIQEEEARLRARRDAAIAAEQEERRRAMAADQRAAAAAGGTVWAQRRAAQAVKAAAAADMPKSLEEIQREEEERAKRRPKTAAQRLAPTASAPAWSGWGSGNAAASASQAAPAAAAPTVSKPATASATTWSALARAAPPSAAHAPAPAVVTIAKNPAASQRRAAAARPAASTAPRSSSGSGSSDLFWEADAGAGTKETTSAFGGPLPSASFGTWCASQLSKLTGSDDLTLVHFLLTLDDDAEIRQYVTEYLGASDASRAFADEFNRQRHGGNRKDSSRTASAAATPASPVARSKNADDGFVTVGSKKGGKKKNKSKNKGGQRPQPW